MRVRDIMTETMIKLMLEGEAERRSEAAVAEALAARVAGDVSIESRFRRREDDGGMR